MILYHGTTVEVRSPKIFIRNIGRDFGPAFYTTDIQQQAERWARRRAMIEARKGKSKTSAIVNVYDWNENNSLNRKDFEGASMDWMEMVLLCRKDPKYHHEYDVVSGKIADDNVGETISYVMQGIMRKEDAVQRLQFEKINNQIAFCTEKALESLHFVKCYEVR